MKFIYTHEDLTLADVPENQFFVTIKGYLAQKRTPGTYIILAKPDGTPWAEYFLHGSPQERISRILPAVEKIEF